jgi:hypothetical protein
MSKGACSLGEIDRPMVRLYCSHCHRFAQFKRTTLLERFGPDKVIPSMLRDLKPCNIGNSLSGPQCQLGYFDRMTDAALAEAITKGGLPESWS